MLSAQHSSLLRSVCDNQRVEQSELRRDVHHQRSAAGHDALMYASQEGRIPVMEFLYGYDARANDGTTQLVGIRVCAPHTI